MTVTLRGVLLRVGVRPSQDSRDVELIISTQNLTETVCIWSEHIIRSYKPTVTSLRSKLCQVKKDQKSRFYQNILQVYSASQDRQTCRLSSFETLTDPQLGYIDLKGFVTLNIR